MEPTDIEESRSRVHVSGFLLSPSCVAIISVEVPAPHRRACASMCLAGAVDIAQTKSPSIFYDGGAFRLTLSYITIDTLTKYYIPKNDSGFGTICVMKKAGGN